jgi:hypothetical protein
MTGSRPIYVALLGEGTTVWRPVAAEPVGPGAFRLLGPVPPGESWQFQPGEVVRCREYVFSDGSRVWVAEPMPPS